jgi:hypothetical protein
VKYITLVNLLATDELYPADLRPYDPQLPGNEKVLLPEYPTSGDKSAALARHCIQWLTDESARQSPSPASPISAIESRRQAPATAHRIHPAAQRGRLNDVRRNVVRRWHGPIPERRHCQLSFHTIRDRWLAPAEQPLITSRALTFRLHISTSHSLCRFAKAIDQRGIPNSAW